MTLQPRHIVLATLLHVVLFTFLFVGVQCSQPIPPTPVVQGVLINPNDLKQLQPSTPKPPPPKPDETDTGPQQIVNSNAIAEQAKEEQKKAAAEAEARQQEDQKAQQEAAAKAEEQRQKDEAAKAKAAEELHQAEEAQKLAAQQEAQKKAQEEAQRKAEAEAAAKAEMEKEIADQKRLQAQKEQEAQAAALAQKKKAEEARQADLRRRQAEFQKTLCVESANLTQDVQNQWVLQLIAAIKAHLYWPEGSSPNLKTYLNITLGQNGDVQSVSVATSSGSLAADQAVQQAVRQASPLPLPKDPSAFDPNLKNICFSMNEQACNQ
jgi:colicin import membrane protein